MNIRYPIYEGVYRILTVKKGRRMAMPSIKRDYAVGRPKPKQTLPGPGKVCPWIISQYRNQSQTRH